MPEPAETSAPPPRWPWLDRWFEPPWRALLTWGGLATLSGWALDLGAAEMVDRMVRFTFDQLDRELAMPLPRPFREIAFAGNLYFLAFWFEPLALRLNTVRGLAWLGARIVPFAAQVLGWQLGHNGHLSSLLLVSAVLAVPVLSGWRSRPWMALLAGVLMAGICFYRHLPTTPGFYWLWWPETSLPYAVVLLYGTRRLPR